MDKSSKKIVTNVKTEIALCVKMLNVEFRKKDNRNKHKIREALRKLQDMKLEDRRFKEFPLIESVRLHKEESGDIGEVSRALLARWPKQDPRKQKPQTNLGSSLAQSGSASNKRDDGASKSGTISASRDPLVKESEATAEKSEEKAKGSTLASEVKCGSNSKPTGSGSANSSSSSSSIKNSLSSSNSVNRSSSSSSDSSIGSNGRKNESNVTRKESDGKNNTTIGKESQVKNSANKETSVKSSSNSNSNKSSNSNSNKASSSHSNKDSSSNSKKTESKSTTESNKESNSKTNDSCISKESASKDKKDTSKNITKPSNVTSSVNVCDWFDKNNNESASMSIRKSSNSKTSEKNESSSKSITTSKSDLDHKISAEGSKNVQVLNQPKVERATKKVSRNIRELTKLEFALDGIPKLRNLDDASATLRNESTIGAASSSLGRIEHTETKKKDLKDQAGINKSDGRKESSKINESRKSEVDLSELFFSQSITASKPSTSQSGSASAVEAKEKEVKKSATENKVKSGQDCRNKEGKVKESKKIDHGALLERQNFEESTRSASGISNSQSCKEIKGKGSPKSGRENKELSRKSEMVSVKSSEKLDKPQSGKSNQKTMFESNFSARKEFKTGGGKKDTSSKAKREEPCKTTVDDDLYLSDDSLPDISTSMEISETSSPEVQTAGGKGKSILGKRKAEESSDDQIESKKVKKEKKEKVEKPKKPVHRTGPMMKKLLQAIRKDGSLGIRKK